MTQNHTFKRLGRNKWKQNPRMDSFNPLLKAKACFRFKSVFLSLHGRNSGKGTITPLWHLSRASPLTFQSPHRATRLDLVPGNLYSWQHYPTHKVPEIRLIEEDSPACHWLQGRIWPSLLGPTVPGCFVLGTMSRQCDCWFTAVCQWGLPKVSTTGVTCSVCDGSALCSFSSETQHLHRPGIHGIWQMSTQVQPLLWWALWHQFSVCSSFSSLEDFLVSPCFDD